MDTLLLVLAVLVVISIVGWFLNHPQPSIPPGPEGTNHGEDEAATGVTGVYEAHDDTPGQDDDLGLV